jgi:2-polyprenyl-6-methoxyphenol hydroxylase-like FAD-dependent oxidoreductase
METVDVVVVGAGPVGLLTAIELTLGGVRVLVLERLAASSAAMKALSLGPLGSEALQRRGMSAAIVMQRRAASRQSTSSPNRAERTCVVGRRSSAAISPACR